MKLGESVVFFVAKPASKYLYFSTVGGTGTVKRQHGNTLPTERVMKKLERRALCRTHDEKNRIDGILMLL